ncbi:uncharacterized protein DDB_G0274171-like [Sycon ciliatum]|uniref:uncharacterized protein DDB_G0274171-like n=1 Tax=Sycon ciliatum TaxID=27933 RepID=UPI0031F65C27
MARSLTIALVLTALVAVNSLSIVPADKEGICPRVMTRPACFPGDEVDECTFDVQCTGRKKCCPDVCARTCRCPELTCRLDCSDQGGFATGLDGCPVCRCASPPTEEPPTLNCNLVDCKPVECYNAITPPGQCCQVCPTLPPLDCALVLCAAPDCLNYYVPEGQCCPVCPTPLPPLDCALVRCAAPHCDNYYVPEGQCCPVCPPPLDCTAVLCLRPVCSDGSEPVTPQGQCCPVCPTPGPTKPSLATVPPTLATVPPTPTCPKNEVYSQCQGGACQPTCQGPVNCLVCSPGCRCKAGYVKLFTNGPCVPEKNCPTCGANEEYQQCGGACQPTCSSSVVCRACFPGCACKTGYIKRSANGPCIPKKLCPSCPANAEYTECGGICQPTCTSIYTCYACSPGCSCKQGYILSSANGQCIPTKKCRGVYKGK